MAEPLPVLPLIDAALRGKRWQGGLEAGVLRPFGDDLFGGHVERRVDHLVSAPVGHPEHQVRDAAARGDRDLVREEDAGRGARELGEGEAGDHRAEEQAEGGLLLLGQRHAHAHGEAGHPLAHEA